MPLVKVEMLEGRSEEQKEALISAIAEAVMNAIGAPEESIRVRISEYSNRHWGMGKQQAYKLGR